MDELLGSRYVLHEKVGQGGMGQVFRGSVRESGTPVAVKVLKPELVTDPDIVARFFQERSILLSIAHANVVKVIDLVVEGQTLAIVMEFVQGQDLRHELLDKHTLTPAEVARYGSQLLDGLAAVHAAGIVHRDVKPENLLLDTSGSRPDVKLTDFGVARLTYGGSLTRVSSLIGTPEYMAPELADHETATAAADLYSAGIVLYELLAGRTPFGGGHPVAVLRRHIDEPPPPIPGAPVQLWTFIAQLLAKDPDSRPSSAAQLAAALAVMQPSLAGLPALEPMAAPVFRPAAAKRAADHPATQVVPKPADHTAAPIAVAPVAVAPAAVAPAPVAFALPTPPPGPIATPNPSGPPVYYGQVPGQPVQPPRSRGLTVIVAVLIAVLIVGGAAVARVFIYSSPKSTAIPPSRPVSYVFTPQTYPDGLLIVRHWTLSGPDGSLLTESVAASSSDGQPHQVTFFEAIPTSIAASVTTVRFTPAATVVKADPEVRWRLSLPPHGSVTVGYRAAVPPRGATTARLDAWARALSALQTQLHLTVPATEDIQSLTITPATMALFQKQSVQLKLSGQLASGLGVPARQLAGAAWTSTNPSVAYVSSTGVLTATGTGSTDITANVAGVLASATVTVSAPVVITTPAPTPTGGGGGGGGGGTVISGYRVFHSCLGNSCGLSVHSGPGDDFPVVGDLANNEPIEIACQASGETRTNTLGISSDVWDKLATGGYVSDLYVDTPGERLTPTESGFTDTIPRC